MSEVAIAILFLAGACIMLTRDARVLLGAFALHTIVLAWIAAPSAGWPMSLALLIGNIAAVGIIALGLFASEASSEAATANTPEMSSIERLRRRQSIWRRRQGGFLQGLSVLLAAVVAYGLGDKPIPGTTEASSGLPSIIAYWALAAGLVILLLNRDALKIGSGVVFLVNAGQMAYLMSARYLQSLVMIAAVGVLLASAMAISRLLVVKAEVPDTNEEEVHDSPLDPDPELESITNAPEAHESA
jgi:hypothetical protein